MNPLEKKQEELIRVLYSQVADLSMMSKIELGDDVIIKLREIESEIAQMKATYVPFISEVEEFNAIMGKPNNYNPVIPDEKE
jgi:hypothetical protein